MIAAADVRRLYFGARAGLSALLCGLLVLFFSTSITSAQSGEGIKSPAAVSEAKPPPVPLDNTAANRRQRVYLAGMMVALLAAGAWYLCSQKKMGPVREN